QAICCTRPRRTRNRSALVASLTSPAERPRRTSPGSSAISGKSGSATFEVLKSSSMLILLRSCAGTPDVGSTLVQRRALKLQYCQSIAARSPDSSTAGVLIWKGGGVVRSTPTGLLYFEGYLTLQTNRSGQSWRSIFAGPLWQ